MTNINTLLGELKLNSTCPFSDGMDRTISLKEALFVSGYLINAEEIRCIESAIKTKRQSSQITDEEQQLLEQVHEEIKTFYGMVATDVNTQKKTELETTSEVIPTP